MCESTLVAKVKKNTLTVRDAEKMISILGIDNPTEVFFYKFRHFTSDRERLTNKDTLFRADERTA